MWSWMEAILVVCYCFQFQGHSYLYCQVKCLDNCRTEYFPSDSWRVPWWRVGCPIIRLGPCLWIETVTSPNALFYIDDPRDNWKPGTNSRVHARGVSFQHGVRRMQRTRKQFREKSPSSTAIPRTTVYFTHHGYQLANPNHSCPYFLCCLRDRTRMDSEYQSGRPRTTRITGLV